jgi:PRTRC genetic system protein B
MERSGISLELYKPQQVIICYSDGRDFYLEQHDYFNASGKLVMGAGKPLTKASLKKMLSLVTAHDKSVQATVKNLLPQNLLYLDQRIGRQVMVWYSTTPRQKVHFKSGSIKSGVVTVPPMLYAVKDGTLSVYALANKKRPDWKTKLYHAPFFNVYENGSVCMGNVKRPDGIVDISASMEAWEKAFWCSEFTLTVWDKAYKKLDEFWKKKMKAKRIMPFPMKMLVQCKKPISFQELCEKI